MKGIPHFTVEELQRQLDDVLHDHRRTLTDLVVTLNSRAWGQGWLIGFVTGVALVMVAWAVW